jgi:hypothetical protein
VLRDAPPHDVLEQRPGEGVAGPAVIALREGIEAGALEANIETGAQRHRSRPREIVLDAGKELAERVLAAGEQRMHMSGLRRPRPVRHVRW